MAIDVGAACIDRISSFGAFTFIGAENPANATGTIDFVCIYANANMSNIEVASFVHEGSDVLSTNDTASLGTAIVGANNYNAPGDFSAFNINTGEYIGIYYTAGELDITSTGGSGAWYLSNDQIPCSSVAFSWLDGDSLSLHATGTETGGVTLTISPLGHTQSLDTFALTQKHNLTINDLSHIQTLDNITLEAGVELIVQALSHSHGLDGISLTQKHQLIINALSHTQTLDAINITQKHSLALQELLHSQALDNIDLTQKHSITVADLQHSHLLDNITLSVATQLVVAGLAHAHILDGLTLTQKHILIINALSHIQALDNITLTQKHILATQALQHIHTLDNIVWDEEALTQYLMMMGIG